MKKRILGLVVLVMGLLSVYGTDSTPSVVLVSAAQRYPWNNVVDYTYALSNCNASKTYKLAVGLTVGGVTKVSTNDLTTVSDGNYTGTIDAATLFPNMFDKAGKINLQLIEAK